MMAVLLAAGCGVGSAAGNQAASADNSTQYVADAGVDGASDATGDDASDTAGEVWVDAGVAAADAGQTAADTCQNLQSSAEHCGTCQTRCEVACDRASCVRAIQVSAAADHICVVLGDGQVRCSGANDHGQLGDGTTQDSQRPVSALGMDDAQLAVAADQSSCALRASGQVYCWGARRQDQAGSAEPTDQPRPVRWGQLSDVVALDVQQRSGCAVSADGRLRCWGAGEDLGPTLVEDLGDVRQVEVGDYHRCVVAGAGVVACWGNNAHGQLGDGTSADRRQRILTIPGLNDAVEVAVGTEHTCVRRASGAIQCFGDNSDGQIGVDALGGVLRPTAVAGIADAADLAAGDRHNCAIVSDAGQVKCWGDNARGQLGDGTSTATSTPVAVHGLPPATEVDAGGQTSCAVTVDGQVYCWGKRFGFNPQRVDF